MVESATIQRDTIFFIKDLLDGLVTDPISSSRPANQKFILTAYPQRRTQYPVITIKLINQEAPIQLGFQAEAMPVVITAEIRCWGRTTKERDDMADSTFSVLRTNQIGSSGESQANDLHDLKLLSEVEVNEPNGPKSKLLTISYLFIAT